MCFDSFSGRFAHRVGVDPTCVGGFGCFIALWRLWSMCDTITMYNVGINIGKGDVNSSLQLVVGAFIFKPRDHI